MEITCRQALADDASFFSIQRTLLPATITEVLSAGNLLERYLAYIRYRTLGIIRPMVSHSGVEFRLLDTKLEPDLFFAAID